MQTDNLFTYLRSQVWQRYDSCTLLFLSVYQLYFECYSFFYRAKHYKVRGLSRRRIVCLSVRPSVTVW